MSRMGYKFGAVRSAAVPDISIGVSAQLGRLRNVHTYIFLTEDLKITLIHNLLPQASGNKTCKLLSIVGTPHLIRRSLNWSVRELVHREGSTSIAKSFLSHEVCVAKHDVESRSNVLNSDSLQFLKFSCG